jgi:uncharacterized membrane protein
MADNSGTSSIDENVAGLLSYLFGWVTGLIFFLLDKRHFVRFHAMQSIVLSVALIIVYTVLSFLPYIGWILSAFLGIGTFILWILLMVRAYQHQMWKLPLIGDLAEQWSK